MKKLLVVVDMQNDFIDGALGTKEAISIVPFVANKIEEYKAMNMDIIFTRDTHDENYLNTQEGVNLPVEHCIEGTHGHAISSELNTENSVIVDKSSFGSLGLAGYISEKYSDVSEIELVGLCTDICVISNAIILKSTMPESIISVDASCCAGVTPETHINALKAMKMCQINIILNGVNL